MMTLTLGHEYLMTGMIWGEGLRYEIGARVDALSYAWPGQLIAADCRSPHLPGLAGTALLQRSSNRP
jgi:hypothetical protein